MVEVQGQVEKIDYLLGCLYKIKRFKILNCEECRMIHNLGLLEHLKH